MSRQILKIDDSDIAQDVIRATLIDFGFDDVVSYLDPTEALSAITAAETWADLVLLDIVMPEMDGIELCAPDSRAGQVDRRPDHHAHQPQGDGLA